MLMDSVTLLEDTSIKAYEVEQVNALPGTAPNGDMVYLMQTDGSNNVGLYVRTGGEWYYAMAEMG